MSDREGRGSDLVDAAAVAILVAIGLALRWPNAAQGIWWDEYLVPYYASLTFEQFIRAFVAEEAHPPLYFVLTRLVVDRFGDAPTTLRALSLIAGLAQIPLTYALGRLFLGRRSQALVAAALITCWPWHVDFSSHARMYTLFTLLASASTGAFAVLVGSATSRSRARWAVVYALVTGFGLLTHYYMVLVVATHALWYVVARGWRDLPPTALLASWLGAAAIFYPWFWISNILPSSPTFGGALTPWVPDRGFELVLGTLDTALGRHYSRWVLVPSVALCAVLAVRALWKRRERRPWLLLTWTLLPPLLLGGVSLVLALTHGSPVYQARQLIFVLPGALLLVAAAVGQIHNRVARAFLVMGLIATALGAPIARIPAQEFVVETLVEQARPTDVVLVFPTLSHQVLAHYARGTPARDMPILPLLEFQDSEQSALRRTRAIAKRAERVWVIERHLDDVALGEAMPELHAAALAGLEASMIRDRVWMFLGVCSWQLSLYVPAPEAMPAHRTIRVQVDLPASPLSRQTLLIASGSQAASPARFPAQPLRWFGTVTGSPTGGYDEVLRVADAASGYGEALGEALEGRRTTVNLPVDGRRRMLAVLTKLGPLQWLEGHVTLGFSKATAPREVTIRQAQHLPPVWLASWIQLVGEVLLLLGVLAALVPRRIAALVCVALVIGARGYDPFEDSSFARLNWRQSSSPAPALVQRIVRGETSVSDPARSPARQLAWVRFGPGGLVGAEPYEARLLERLLAGADGESPVTVQPVRGEPLENPEIDPDLLVIDIDVTRSAEDLFGDDWEPVDATVGAGDGPRVIVAVAGSQPGIRLLESRRARARVLEVTVADLDRGAGDPADDPCAPSAGAVARLQAVLDVAVERGWLEAKDSKSVRAEFASARVALSALDALVSEVGHGRLGADAFRGSLPLMLDGVRYERGLDAHAPSCGIWWLGGGFQRLVGRAGLWDSGNPERGVSGDFAGERGEVRFEILVDGRVAWRSSPRHWNDPAVQFDVALDGARALALRVQSEGSLEYDWSIWADVWLEPAVPAQPVAPAPAHSM